MSKFIDICFPKNNEISFIEVAKKIKTNGLIFVYEKEVYRKKLNASNERKYEDILIYRFCIEKDIFLFNEKYKKKLCFIDDNYKFPEKITQVFVKRIKENKLILGISPWFLKSNIPTISRYRLFLKLCKKYNVDLFISSLAKNPFELKEKRQLNSILNIFVKDTSYSKKALNIIEEYLKNNNSTEHRFI